MKCAAGEHQSRFGRTLTDSQEPPDLPHRQVVAEAQLEYPRIVRGQVVYDLAYRDRG